MKADSWLASALAAGPRVSRDVRDLAARAGITDKALRGARLRLGLVVTRSGNGQNMRSTWALPAQHGEPAAAAASTPAPEAAARKPAAKVPARGEPRRPTGSINGAPHDRAGLTVDELARVERRVGAFVARHGLSIEVASAVATRLVLERDRLESRAGSCVECQNFRGPGACSAVVMGTQEVARPVAEIWMCWLARRDL